MYVNQLKDGRDRHPGRDGGVEAKRRCNQMPGITHLRWMCDARVRLVICASPVRSLQKIDHGLHLLVGLQADTLVVQATKFEYVSSPKVAPPVALGRAISMLVTCQ
jgi:hypothetical protein